MSRVCGIIIHQLASILAIVIQSVYKVSIVYRPENSKGLGNILDMQQPVCVKKLFF